MTLFADIAMAPRDPILGLNEQFAADPREHKVNLGVGVYHDESGKLPLLRCVAEAEARLMTPPKPRGYLPIDGIAAYDRAVQALVFGDDGAATARIATVQALGGTGGLKVGADLLRRVAGRTRVLISDPSWENHRALFANAGFDVGTYPYYDAARRGVDFDAMLGCLRSADAGTVVVLHACCHNPTGYDLDTQQWRQVVAALRERGLLAFVDMAYQGFAAGLAEDRALVDLLRDAGVAFLVATSFSKSFSLYGERVGALSVVCESADEAARVLSQLKIAIRTNYSNPPTHGAQVVAAVLADAELRALWQDELAGMRRRIRRMRSALVEQLRSAGAARDFSFVERQQGMFSYTGLARGQMQRLRDEFAVYGVDSGRICVAALNEHNVGRVGTAIARVL